MKSINRYLALALLALAPTLRVAAQSDSSSYNESVIVVGDYKPVIENAVKLNVAPFITDTATTMQHSFVYSITPQRLTSIFSPARLGYVKITEPPTRIYNNYLRLGMGNYWTPLADLYYHSTRNKNLSYGARALHTSSWGKIGKADSIPSADYYGKNHFSTTDLSAYGKYILKENHLFQTALSYSNDYHMFYGFSDSLLYARDSITHDSLSKKDYAMAYNRLQWHIGAKSLNTDVNQFGYEASYDVQNLWGRYGMGEWAMKADATVHYGFPMFKQYKAIAYLNLGWEGFGNHYYPQYSDDSNTLLYLPYDYLPLTADSVMYTRHFLHGNPYVDFLFGGFQIHAGARMAVGPKQMGDSSTFYFYPDIMVSKDLMHNAMNISLGATGNLDPNSWDELRLLNPYVAPASMLKATSHYDFFARMRFSFNKKLELNARALYTVYNNGLLFRLDSCYALENVYEPYYRNYQKLTLGADITFVNDEMIRLNLGGNYYAAHADYRDFPLLYQPKFDAHLGTHINYKDKVLVGIQGLMVGPMYGDAAYTNAISSDYGHYMMTDTLGVRYGFNVEVEYVHTRALSFFVKADNILCQRYFLWSHYPSQRLNVMLGLTYTIPTKKH